MTHHANWSLGVLVGLPFVTIVTLAILCFIAWCFVPADEWGLGLIGVAVLAVWLALVTLAYWPLKAEYHKWQPHGGTVATVDSRLVSAGDGKGMETKFVVTFAGDPVQVGCTDTRCATVKPGDQLWLKCIRVFEWAATDGYDCRFDTWTPAVR